MGRLVQNTVQILHTVREAVLASIIVHVQVLNPVGLAVAEGGAGVDLCIDGRTPTVLY